MKLFILLEQLVVPYCTQNKIILDTFLGKFCITTERGGTEYNIIHYISKFTVIYTLQNYTTISYIKITHT
jgi:archaellum biogenesis protein FlaJ (TadC family)